MASTHGLPLTESLAGPVDSQARCYSAEFSLQTRTASENTSLHVHVHVHSYRGRTYKALVYLQAFGWV